MAARAAYEGRSKHKLSPWAFGLEPAPAVSEDPTYCDAHAGFAPADMPRIGAIIRRGIMAGLIGDTYAQGNPRLLWAIDDNGWTYEFRVTNPSQAIYHGYPLLPGDAMATKVIGRFSRWMPEHAGDERHAAEAFRSAQERYRG